MQCDSAATKPNQLMMKQSMDLIMYLATAHPPLSSQTSDEEEEEEVKGACLHLICRK